MPLCICCPHIHNCTLILHIHRYPHTDTRISQHASLNSELKFNPPFHLGLKNTNACKLANFVLSLADQCAAHLLPTHARVEKCFLHRILFSLHLSSFYFCFAAFLRLCFISFCTLHIFLICNLRTLLIFSILFVFRSFFIRFLYYFSVSLTAGEDLAKQCISPKSFPYSLFRFVCSDVVMPKCWKIKIGANDTAKFIFIGMPIKCARN